MTNNAPDRAKLCQSGTKSPWSETRLSRPLPLRFFVASLVGFPCLLLACESDSDNGSAPSSSTGGGASQGDGDAGTGGTTDEGHGETGGATGDVDGDGDGDAPFWMGGAGVGGMGGQGAVSLPDVPPAVAEDCSDYCTGLLGGGCRPSLRERDCEYNCRLLSRTDCGEEYEEVIDCAAYLPIHSECTSDWLESGCNEQVAVFEDCWHPRP